MDSENEEYNNSKVNIGSQNFNTDKNTELNKLIEEYQIATSKKNVYINREDILKEIFLTVNNRLQIDPFIINKLNFKKKKSEEGCCYLF